VKQTAAKAYLYVLVGSSHVSNRVALLCGVFVQLHLALFPAGGPFLPSLSVNISNRVALHCSPGGLAISGAPQSARHSKASQSPRYLDITASQVQQTSNKSSQCCAASTYASHQPWFHCPHPNYLTQQSDPTPADHHAPGLISCSGVTCLSSSSIHLKVFVTVVSVRYTKGRVAKIVQTPQKGARKQPSVCDVRSVHV
jgi:hypothetical protein